MFNRLPLFKQKVDSMMPQTASAPCHVFVYGTLRAGGSNDIARYAPPPERVGSAFVAGTLYDLGDYPGAVLDGMGRIAGEVYRITPEVEGQLDALEGVMADESGEYIKREIAVSIEGRTLDCLVYEIHPSRLAGRPVIRSGDWFARERL